MLAVEKSRGDVSTVASFVVSPWAASGGVEREKRATIHEFLTIRQSRSAKIRRRRQG